ncbi:ferritin-like domain-containing protein [Cystobacter fuscus]|uniref:ferritin-like domain-containing protein n=1 Tax=Cystobacter fuscus TaxID=43 RepID=UPI002B2AE4A8|nr:hypothetical protein F0U63_37805 [Cystobacter fuscus]
MILHSKEPLTSRESLIAALSEAAEIEHSITCQYLFAAFSLKVHPEEGGVDWVSLEQVRGWKAELLTLARQEMMHHGLVCNLLLAIGGAPHFRRAGFPHPVRLGPVLSTFDLVPFSAEVLERFIAYERPDDDREGVPDGGRTIDGMYQLIREGLIHVERSGTRLFVGPVEHQLTNQELRIRPGQFDMELTRASAYDSALALIDRIREHGHLARVKAIQRELSELTRADPTFAPARPVVVNPRWQEEPKRTDGEGTALQHPLSCAAAELFDGAYEVMILMLTRLYGRADETPAEMDGLIRTAFFPLMTAVIRPLGEMLTQMPASEGNSTGNAGPCFGIHFTLPLPPNRRTAWLLLHERQEKVALAAALLEERLRKACEPWAARLLPRFQLLRENLERIANNFARQMGLERNALDALFKSFR